MEKKIDRQFAALMIIEILFEKGLINEETFKNVKSKCSTTDSHISQTV